MEQANERLKIAKTEHSAPSRKRQEGIERCQVSPSGGERAQGTSQRVVKKHARLTPSDTLCEKGKLLTDQRMEGMGNGKQTIPIQLIGRS